MNLTQRIHAFAKLGRWLEGLTEDEFQSLADKAARENPWFTKDNVRLAVNGVVHFLQQQRLEAWVTPYTFPTGPKTVAIVMAGNIPLVGFHDFLSVLISGHTAMIKLSSKDTALLRELIEKLVAFEPDFRHRIIIAEQLKDFQAVIATGSDNTARYFDFYFGKYPHVIRKNRTSVALLDGTESVEELKALGRDVFSYFGLGCRNISKILAPAGYSFVHLLDQWESYHDVIHHHKYCNNYDYQKSILLVNSVPFLDNNFVMLQESTRLVSPIAVLYYEYYTDAQHLAAILEANRDKIQCIVGKRAPATVTAGSAQYPDLADYADGVDTLRFLASL